MKKRRKPEDSTKFMVTQEMCAFERLFFEVAERQGFEKDEDGYVLVPGDAVARISKEARCLFQQRSPQAFERLDRQMHVLWQRFKQQTGIWN